MAPMDGLFSALAFLPAFLVIVAVVRQSKNVAALAQLGSVVGRSEEKMDGVAEGVVDEARQNALKEHCAALVKDKDKMVFTAAAFNIAFTCFLFGRYPEHFWMWHVPKFVVLTTLRWITFKGEGKHYLLYDFCYWANGLCAFYTLYMPTSPVVFQVLFLVANGPLAWSILAFSQSLVLHSLQHMTSVFIHVSPMLLTLGLRWIDNPGRHGFAVVEEGPDAAGPMLLVARGVVYMYLPWVLIYYTWVFVLMGPRIQSRGYSTLFDRVTGMAIGKSIAGVPDTTQQQLIRKAVYLLAHLGFGTGTMCFAALMYQNFYAHFLFAVCVMLASAWNGASFYGKVWALRYQAQVQEAAEKMVRDAKSTIVK
eukprot:CAMPEP_0114137926 /NCGR_PEP_ID=MMETSP0043_2-20121206/16033_1 /TAXON_ID=464988 /ORGANISM="Hemiselmis andersenii, Strain CCMP644" /LENGTH=364 /DNA_ID=CAMNT_0001231829 /DNA_START=73 /DNA_END=1167 /DNA_ORIENTATION=+